MKTIKKYIQKLGEKDKVEIYLLKEDVIKLINERIIYMEEVINNKDGLYNKYEKAEAKIIRDELEELKSKIQEK